MTDKAMTAEEYHRRFADRIIEQIKRGAAPWQKPWKPGERILPCNLDTDRPYSGGNSLHLAVVAQDRGYSDTRWGTYRQIQAQGGRIRKGERGTRILSFQDHRRIAVKDPQGRPVTDEQGRRVYRYERLSTPWNDEIVFPERGQFPSASHYYQTAQHELGHSTGHPERMNRESLLLGLEASFGSQAYAKEELRAEISAMMTGRLGRDQALRRLERRAARRVTPVAERQPGRSRSVAAEPQRERTLPLPDRGFGPSR